MATAATVTKAYKFALDPTPRQARMFASHAGGARFAYNWGNRRILTALDARQAEKDATGEATTKVPSHFDLCKQWTAWKDEHAHDPEPPEDERPTNTAWVAENFVGTYQAALRDAAKAWSDFFKSAKGERKGRRLGRPRFKKKGKSRDSFQVHGQTLRLDGPVHVILPKIGRVAVLSDASLHPAMARSRTRATKAKPRHMGNRRRARTLHRALQRSQDTRITRGTITRGADGLWWLSLTAEIPHRIPATPTRAQREGGTIGVDFGVREIATCSNGVRIRNPRHLEAALAELKAAQRDLSRTQRDSKRREKARQRVGLIHADVARLRADALHRASTVLVRQHGVIAVEGWDVQETARYRVRGRKRKPRPGEQRIPARVRKDRNRALADAGIGMARQMLTYKGQWAGIAVLAASPQAKTGRTCSVDGKARTTPLPPHHEQFTSDQCGHVLDRRLNTAQALASWAAQELRRGPSSGGPSQPRGGDVRPGAGRKAGPRQSPAKRAASTRPRRGQAGAPSG